MFKIQRNEVTSLTASEKQVCVPLLIEQVGHPAVSHLVMNNVREERRR